MQKTRLLLFGLLLGLFSCSLDSEEPQFTANDFQNYFNLAYNNTRSYIDAYYNISEASTDEMIPLSAESAWNGKEYWQRLYQHTWQAGDPQFLDLWNQAYDGINFCNLGLSEARSSNLGFIAELKTLRAFNYYLLLDCFGGVPILTDDNTGRPFPERASRIALFNFIEQDLLSALPDLAGTPIYGRINKDVANAILAKLYLNAEVYTGNPAWAKCIDACAAIENSGNYSLGPDYFNNFTADNQISGNNETIFYIIYDLTAIPSGVQMDLAARSIHPAQLGSNDTPPSPFLVVNPNFYNLFHPEDYRANAFLVGLQFADFDEASGVALEDSKGNPLDYTVEILEFPFVTESTGVRTLKYQIDSGRNGAFANNDFAVFRYSDIILMHAEALIQLSKNQEAIALINEVRTRAFQGSAEDIEFSAALHTEELLRIVLQERGYELFWEGLRRQDLIRHNQFCNSRLFKEMDDNCEKRMLFPIPQQIINENPLITQNPGY